MNTSLENHLYDKNFLTFEIKWFFRVSEFEEPLILELEL